MALLVVSKWLRLALVQIFCLVFACCWKQPCPDSLSIVLKNTSSLVSISKNVTYDGLDFPATARYVDRQGQFRGCPCLVTNCIRRCCPPGQVYDIKTCRVPENRSDYPRVPPIPSPPKVTLEFDGDLDSHFYVIYSDKIERLSMWLMLEDEESFPTDTFSIKSDGTMVLNQTVELTYFDRELYCIGWSTENNSTFFNVILKDETASQRHLDKIFRYLQSIGNMVSVFLLVITFVIYAIFPELRSSQEKILMPCVFSFTIAFTCIQFIKHEEIQNKLLQTIESCKAIAYIVHFSFLASFFWLNVMCFDIWWTFGGFRSLQGSAKQRERKKFVIYSIYAWGCASCFTITCMVMDLAPGIPDSIIKPSFGFGACWFGSKEARFIYFYAPMGVTILCNIFFFVLTATKILKHKRDTGRQLKGSDSKRHHDDSKQWFNLYLKLFIVMGINWSTEIISYMMEGKGLDYLWYVTDLANTLQGVIIFVIFVCKDKIKRLLLKRFGCQDGKFSFRHSTSRNGGNTTNSTASRTCVTTAPLQEKPLPLGSNLASARANKTTNVAQEATDRV